MQSLFQAIVDPTRRTLLGRLRTEGPLSVSDLAEPLSMTRQAVTKHLDALEEAGLVEHQRRGRERVHRLNPEPLRALEDWLAPYAAAWDRRLERLEHYLDSDEE